MLEVHMRPKFSIITVTLNAEKTISSCLQSIVNQSFADFEHIVIDGGSKDRTLEIIRSFGVSVVISGKDSGIYNAMNKGAKLAQGVYLTFLNADDTLNKDYLSECNRLIGTNDFLSCANRLIWNNESSLWKPKKVPFQSASFLWRMPFPHPGLMVKTTIFKALEGFDEQFKIASDYDFIIRLTKNYQGIFIDQVLVDFYLGGVSFDRRILRENHNVRQKNYRNRFLLCLAYMLDIIRWKKQSLKFL